MHGRDDAICGWLPLIRQNLRFRHLPPREKAGYVRGTSPLFRLLPWEKGDRFGKKTVDEGENAKHSYLHFAFPQEKASAPFILCRP